MKNNLTLIRYSLPSYWASYLINHDASGLQDNEQAEIDAWMSKKNLPSPCDCVDNGFHSFNDANRLGGDVSTYSFLVKPIKPQIPFQTALGPAI